MATVTFDKAQRWYPGADSPAVPGLDLEIAPTDLLAVTAEAAHDLGVDLGSSSGIFCDDAELYADPVQLRLLLQNLLANALNYRSTERELKVTAEGIRQYEQKTYYDGRWKPEYDKWVDMLAGLSNGPGKQIVAWNSALIYDMIFTQPVFYEFPKLQVPTVLMIGDADTTAIGSDIAPPEVKARIGKYPVLGKQVTQMIPGAQLVEFKGMGHAPQMEDPAGFNKALVTALQAK